MSQNTGRIKPGMAVSGKGKSRPSEPSKPTMARTTREPSTKNLGNMVRGQVVTRGRRK